MEEEVRIFLRKAFKQVGTPTKARAVERGFLNLGWSKLGWTHMIHSLKFIREKELYHL